MSILVFDLEKNNSFKIKYFYSVKEEIMEITGNEKMRNILIKIANNIKKNFDDVFFLFDGDKIGEDDYNSTFYNFKSKYKKKDIGNVPFLVYDLEKNIIGSKSSSKNSINEEENEIEIADDDIIVDLIGRNREPQVLKKRKFNLKF